MALVAQSPTIEVLHDDSKLSEIVCQALLQLQLPLHIKKRDWTQLNIDQAFRQPIILIAEQTQIDQLPKVQAEQQLLISDRIPEPEFMREWQGDLLLWPESIGLLQLRVSVLLNWYQVDRQLQTMRESLVWHTNRIDREHQLVEHIFRNSLSRNYLDYAHINTYLTPVSKFNGDLCLIAPGPLGNLYVMMADFTGHGLAPATGALPLSQAFFAMADRGVSVAEMVTEFNFRMSRLLPDDMFCACFILELSANGQRLTYWNGGMPPALIFNNSGQIERRLSAQHMALGVLADEDFDAQVTTLRTNPSQYLALYTDGVTDLLGHKQEFLGSDALEQLIERYHQPSQFQELVAELEHFRGAQPLHDDLSFAVLHCCATGLDETKQKSENLGLPFNFESTLTVAQIRTLEPVSFVLNALSELPRLRPHRTTIYLLLAEAYNNALEHGLLGLDSKMKSEPDGFATYYELRAQRLAVLEEGEIHLKVSYDSDKDRLTFEVTDSGNGWPAHTQTASENQAFGRGLELLHQLTQNLEWSEEGRRIRFEYALSSSSARQ